MAFVLSPLSQLLPHLPFPSGGNSSGGHSIVFVRIALIFVPNTLDAGSKPSFAHILISIMG